MMYNALVSPLFAGAATTTFGEGGVIHNLIDEAFYTLGQITSNDTLMIFVGITLTGAVVGLVRRLIKGARA